MPKSSARWVLNLSSSMKLPGSSRSSIRSRAVSLPSWCCLSIRSWPPPSSAWASSAASFSRGVSPESRSCRCAEDRPPDGSGSTFLFWVPMAAATYPLPRSEQRGPPPRLPEGVLPPAVRAGVRLREVLRHQLDRRAVEAERHVLGPAGAGSDRDVERSAAGSVGGDDLHLLG